MIALTRLNQTSLVLNSDLIESIETTPDTLICLSNGQKLLVREHPRDIVALVLRFRADILQLSAHSVPLTQNTRFGVERCA